MSLRTSWRSAFALLGAAFRAALTGRQLSPADLATVSGDGDLRRAASAVRQVLQAHAHLSFMDPTVVARLAGLTVKETLAGLAVLQDEGLGRYRVMVRDRDGAPVAEYPSFGAVPATVESDFGEEIRTSRANTELVFSLAAA
jgi:hypothetical protein